MKRTETPATAKKNTRPLWDAGLVLLLLAVGVTVLFLLLAFSRPGAVAVITVDGREEGRYPLAQDGTYVLNGGSNTLVIRGGKACLTDSQCPDHLCEGEGWVSRDGQTITCLPNRLQVAIAGGTPADTDLDR